MRVVDLGAVFRGFILVVRVLGVMSEFFYVSSRISAWVEVN